MKKWFKRIAYTLSVLFVLLNVLAAVQAYHATHYYNENLPKKHINEMSFGEKLSAIAFGVRVSKSLVVDSLSIPHTNIQLVTDDSIHLAAWYCENNIDDTIVNAKGTVIMFHGHGSSRSGIINEAWVFYRLGYNVMMVDFRAHGESEGNTCTVGYYESKDVKAAYDYVTSKGEKYIVLYGISLGASTIIKAMHDYKTIRPSHIILEMPFGSLYCAVKGTMRLNHVPEQPASALITFWGGVEHGFWAFGFNPQDEAKDINCKVLLQRGTDDIRVTEEETQAIYKHIPSPYKKLVEYSYCSHESLYKKEPIKWVATVDDFLRR